MPIHWQSQQEYLYFLHKTKVHLDSSQHTRLYLEFGPIREKFRLLDLDSVIKCLFPFYSFYWQTCEKPDPNHLFLNEHKVYNCMENSISGCSYRRHFSNPNGQ